MTSAKGLKVIYGPRIVQASQILKKKIVPSTPMIIAFSEAEWKKAISGIEVTKEPLPRDAMRLIVIRLPPELSSLGSIGLIPFCPSRFGMTCVPYYGPGPADGLFWNCRCYPTETEDEEKEPIKEIPKKCHPVLTSDGKLECQGSCDDGLCATVRTSTEPVQIFCMCLKKRILTRR